MALIGGTLSARGGITTGAATCAALAEIAADIAVRLILPGRDLKLGVLLAILGAPFFLLLILRTRFAQNA